MKADPDFRNRILLLLVSFNMSKDGYVFAIFIMILVGVNGDRLRLNTSGS